MEKQRSLLRRIFSHTLFILNILLVLWSGLCWAAAFISPAKVKYLGIANISLPFAIVANILFVAFWFLFSDKKIRALISAITLVAGYKVYLTVFGLNFFGHNDMTHHDETIKIMSWNAHGLGIFEKGGGRQTAEKMIDYIREQKADIVCMPEYYIPKADSMKPYAKEILAAGYSDYKFCFDNTLGPSIYLGTAIFSKYPIDHYAVHHIGNEWINILQCDIHLKEDRTVRMLFLHMHSFGLSDHDKYYIEELKKSTIAPHLHPGVFLWKFNYAYYMRANEADTVAAIIVSSPYPVFVCGDLNDLPGSYTYMRIRGKLNDAFLDKGKWLGRTFNELSPTLRIDHMFYDPAVLQVIGYKSPRIFLSDHRPIIANFRIL